MAKALAVVAGTLALVAGGLADDREDYNRRAARADAAAFRDLDLDRDGRLTHAEVRAHLGFGPRFDDADIDRDGLVTAEEMGRYIERMYGVEPERASELTRKPGS
jgi:hypothetical protein